MFKILSKALRLSVKAIPVFALGGALLYYAVPGVGQAAPTPAGMTIENQSVVKFTDRTGAERVVRSNMVVTSVLPVFGVDVAISEGDGVAKPGTANSVVPVFYRVTNTGNKDDSFDLSAISVSSDFEMTDIEVYSFADYNVGTPSQNNTIDKTPVLKPGESYDVLVRARVPATITENDRKAILRLTATSKSESSISDFKDRDIISNFLPLLLDISKKFESVTAKPGDEVGVTIQYKNTGKADATDLHMLDVLPAGLTYVENSMLWRVEGHVEDRRIADGISDVEFRKGDQVIFSNTELLYEQANRHLTLRINGGKFPVGWSAFINFKVKVDDNAVTGTKLENRAILTIKNFADKNVAPFQSATNTAYLTVDSLEVPTFAVTIADRQASEYVDDVTGDRSKLDGALASLVDDANGISGMIPEGGDQTPDGNTGDDIVTERHDHVRGSSIPFDVIVTNNGDNVDTFNISDSVKGGTAFPMGTIFSLENENRSPLTDTNGDGISDTGPVDPGQAVRIFVVANLPDNFVGKANWDHSVIATSVNDRSKTNSVSLKMLGEIVEPQPKVADISIRPHDDEIAMFKDDAFTRVYVIKHLQGVGVSAGAITVSKLTENNDITAELFYDANRNNKIDAGEQLVDDIADILDDPATSEVERHLSASEDRQVILRIVSTDAKQGVNLKIQISKELMMYSQKIEDSVMENNFANLVVRLASDNMELVKEQVIDPECDGGNTEFVTDSLEAKPGQCIRYKLTATPSEGSMLNNVSIIDNIPAYTKYQECNGKCLPVSTFASEDISSSIVKPLDVENPEISISRDFVTNKDVLSLEYTVKID